MQPRYFTKTFLHFLLGFLSILALAFALFVAGAQFAPPAAETQVAQ